MQPSGCVPMTNETGHHFFTPQAPNITSTNSTRTYFGGRLLSEYVLSLFALSCSWLDYLQTLRMIYMGRSSAFTSHRSAPKPSQAEMHGMREVFPEAVTYAAVQVSTQSLPYFPFTQTGFRRHTTAFVLLMVGTWKIGFSSSTSSSTSVSDCSLRIQMIHGLPIPSNS